MKEMNNKTEEKYNENNNDDVLEKETDHKKNDYYYKYKNKFIDNFYGKKNLRVTKRFKFLYNFIKKTNLFKNYKSYDFLDKIFSNDNYEKNTQYDMNFNNLTIYEIIPKEYLNAFKADLYNFKAKFENKNSFINSELSIEDNFNRVNSIYSKDSWSYIDTIRINDKVLLSSMIDDVEIYIIGLTDSFFIILFNLNIKLEKKLEFKNILISNIKKDPIIIAKGHDVISAQEFIFFDHSKRFSIYDFILDLEFNFITNFFKNKKAYLFKKLKLINPCLIYLETDDIENNNDRLFQMQNFPIYKDGITKFKIDFSEFIFSKKLFTTVIYEKDVSKTYYDILFYLRNDLAFYHVLNPLFETIKDKFIFSQSMIDKEISKKTNNLKRLLKLKRKLDRELYYFKRLINELQVDSYIKDTAVKYFEELEEEKKFGFKLKVAQIDYIIDKSYKHLKNMYSFFNERFEILKNHVDYRLLIYTFILTLLTFIITILSYNDFKLLDELIQYIKNVLN